MTTKKASKPQEVRQCLDPENRNYGCIAVKSLVPFGDWFIGNPGTPDINACGGHWNTDEYVKNWTLLEPKSSTA